MTPRWLSSSERSEERIETTNDKNILYDMMVSIRARQTLALLDHRSFL